MCKVAWRVVIRLWDFAKEVYHESFWLSLKRLFALKRRYDSSKGFKIETKPRCSAAIHSDRHDQ